MFKKHQFIFTAALLAVALIIAQMPNVFMQTPQAAMAQSAPDCGTEPVTLNAYFETGFDIPFKLAESSQPMPI